MTIDDFHSLGREMKDQTLLAIKAPADTLLEVPRREERKVRRLKMKAYFIRIRTGFIELN